MDRTQEAQSTVGAARKLIPIASVWLHKNGGTYEVTGHELDTDTGQARIRYRRIAGPSFNAVKEGGLEFSRPIDQWTRDRFMFHPIKATKDHDWRCTICGNFKDDGCGQPDRLVSVPYEDGVRLERAACPMAYVGPQRKKFFERLIDYFRD